MLQIWELTGDDKYFKEAEKAARTLTQYGFDVFYQANNTMFSAKAMILLYKQTKKELYRDLAYLFLANIFKNVALWDRNYGFSKNLPTFFALFPLNEAPYTAVDEEQEAYAGAHDLFAYADGLDILPSVNLLLTEFIKHTVNRAAFYYPPMLPKEMLADKVKTGEVDPNLWIALEDIHDGWEPSGSVGQEVYGAGLAFGIIPRQYLKLRGTNTLVFIDYPVIQAKEKGKAIRFKVLGSDQLTCRLCIVSAEGEPLSAFKIAVQNKADQEMIDQAGKDITEFMIHGDQEVTISLK